MKCLSWELLKSVNEKINLQLQILYDYEFLKTSWTHEIRSCCVLDLYLSLFLFVKLSRFRIFLPIHSFTKIIHVFLQFPFLFFPFSLFCLSFPFYPCLFSLFSLYVIFYPLSTCDSCFWSLSFHCLKARFMWFF